MTWRIVYTLICIWNRTVSLFTTIEPLFCSLRFNVSIVTSNSITSTGLFFVRTLFQCIFFRCTNSNCSALLKTDIECTTLFNSRNTHNHKEICCQKLARDVFHKACQCKRWGVNSNELCPWFPSTSSNAETCNI